MTSHNSRNLPDPLHRRAGAAKPTMVLVGLVLPVALASASCRMEVAPHTGGDRWAGATNPATQEASNDPDVDHATVIDVIDGDTVEVELAGTVHRVRLLGVDTPESVHPELPEQCFGREAADALTRLLPVGTVIEIERDVELFDPYQRLLLYVRRRSDGLFVNRWLAEQGLAEAVFYPPNTHYRSEIQQARQRARANGQGLWSRCEGPDQPVD